MLKKQKINDQLKKINRVATALGALAAYDTLHDLAMANENIADDLEKLQEEINRINGEFLPDNEKKAAIVAAIQSLVGSYDSNNAAAPSLWMLFRKVLGER